MRGYENPFFYITKGELVTSTMACFICTAWIRVHNIYRPTNARGLFIKKKKTPKLIKSHLSFLMFAGLLLNYRHASAEFPLDILFLRSQRQTIKLPPQAPKKRERSDRNRLI